MLYLNEIRGKARFCELDSNRRGGEKSGL
ncbi:hypothetical protein DNTS_028486 [Danionella cerebrum]|uniref:Uncharacterized protein n=1 Tax=Danionella cerebrum TaxID=2873325 RepID=A0A553R7H0_9TELE|nr:hypothetical protein DNTS_028486 [Danionella translucida]